MCGYKNQFCLDIYKYLLGSLAFYNSHSVVIYELLFCGYSLTKTKILKIDNLKKYLGPQLKALHLWFTKNVFSYKNSCHSYHVK